MKYLLMLKTLVMGGKGMNGNKLSSLLIAIIVTYASWRWGVDPETVAGLAETLGGLFK